MAEALALGLAAAAGLALGGFFFGGLWWTLHKGLGARQPALWFLGSLLLRLGIVLAGFYAVADGHWPRLLASLGGFLIARLIVLRLLGPSPGRRPVQGREAGHAP